MNLNDWHHYDFGDYRIGVTRIEDDPGTFALLFLVEDTAFPLAYYPSEDAAREALRVLDAGMDALAELHRRARPGKAKKVAGRTARPRKTAKPKRAARPAKPAARPKPRAPRPQRRAPARRRR